MGSCPVNNVCPSSCPELKKRGQRHHVPVFGGGKLFAVRPASLLEGSRAGTSFHPPTTHLPLPFFAASRSFPKGQPPKTVDRCKNPHSLTFQSQFFLLPLSLPLFLLPFDLFRPHSYHHPRSSLYLLSLLITFILFSPRSFYSRDLFLSSLAFSSSPTSSRYFSFLSTSPHFRPLLTSPPPPLLLRHTHRRLLDLQLTAN